MATAAMIRLSARDPSRTFWSFIRRVSSAGQNCCFCNANRGAKLNLIPLSGRDIRRCSLDSTYVCHFSKSIASSCAMISFIRSFSPVAAGNFPAKKRVGVISQTFLFARSRIEGKIFDTKEGSRGSPVRAGSGWTILRNRLFLLSCSCGWLLFGRESFHAPL